MIMGVDIMNVIEIAVAVIILSAIAIIATYLADKLAFKVGTKLSEGRISKRKTVMLVGLIAAVWLPITLYMAILIMEVLGI